MTDPQRHPLDEQAPTTPELRISPGQPTDAGSGPDGGPPAQALDPRIRTVWQLTVLAATLVVAATGILLAVVTTDTARLAFAALVAVTAVLGLVGAFVLVPLRYRRWSYVLGPAALELAHGVLTHRSSTVPYLRVQHIDLTAGPLDRRLGLTSLAIRTASATTDARLPGIDRDEADRLRATILRRAGLDDAA
jgi:membrane protein YdbS with pleckstrin-like domain